MSGVGQGERLLSLSLVPSWLKPRDMAAEGLRVVLPLKAEETPFRVRGAHGVVHGKPYDAAGQSCDRFTSGADQEV